METINLKHYRALELDKVLNLLAKEAGSDESKKKVRNLIFSDNFLEVKNMLKQTEEAFLLVSRFGSPSVRGLRDIEEPLKRAEIGGVLSMEEVLEVGKLLKVINETKKYNENIDENISVKMYFSRLTTHISLERNIFKSIESSEKMSDEASTELANIRRKIRSTQQKIRSILEQMTSSSSYQKHLQDPIVSMRDGRYVLPVKLESRAQIKGVVHGTSATGATIFVEPMKVVDANNEISILMGKEEEEIYRILSVFSGEIAGISDYLRGNYLDLISIDIIFSKARLGIKMNGIVPELNDKGKVNLIEARHPLINKNNVVPIDIKLGIDFDTLMITGPNTGGKTVAIKTLGLLSLMTMCGLMIPAKQGSQISVFSKVLADIGEEQSIEQSLSTFSAHITHVIEILQIADNRSLVLFDELGAGTDPVEGAALAMAIIESVRRRGCVSAITTHYSELKIYALNTIGVENASCEFDIVSLKPTYRLLIGTPGKSNAFAIAKKLGMPPHIINEAKGAVSGEKAEFEEVVTSLEKQRQRLEGKYKEVLKEKEEIEIIKKTKEEEKQKMLDIQKRELDKARLEADRIIQTTQKASNRLLNELDELRKEQKRKGISSDFTKAKYETKNILDDLSEEARTLDASKKSSYKLPRELVVGDTVNVPSLNATGVVLKLPDNFNKVQIQAGIIKTEVDLSSIRLVEDSKITINQSNKGYAKLKRTRNTTESKPKEIDIRGKNVDESLLQIDQFIDDSIFSNHSHIMIIHGKGTGVLKSGVRNHLKRHKSIKAYRPGTFGEGEDGVTIVELR